MEIKFKVYRGKIEPILSGSHSVIIFHKDYLLYRAKYKYLETKSEDNIFRVEDIVQYDVAIDIMSIKMIQLTSSVHQDDEEKEECPCVTIAGFVGSIEIWFRCETNEVAKEIYDALLAWRFGS